MDLTTIFVLAAVVVFGGLLLALITLTKRGMRPLDVTKFRIKWLAVEQQCIEGNIPSYQLAVLNADKLVDQALREKGIQGQTMADRLKASAHLYSDRNAIWTAHKLRNKIAHESDFLISYRDTRTALSGFKRALKDIGAI